MKLMSLLVLGTSLFLASCGHMGGNCHSNEQCAAKSEQCDMKKKECKSCPKDAKDCSKCKETEAAKK